MSVLLADHPLSLGFALGLPYARPGLLPWEDFPSGAAHALCASVWVLKWPRSAAKSLGLSRLRRGLARPQDEALQALKNAQVASSKS